MALLSLSGLTHFLEELRRNFATKLDVMPVGYVYISTSSTSPASLFGGTWEQLQNRFLLAAGSSYNAGSTGGAATHTLTNAQLPQISGTIEAGKGDSSNGLGVFRSGNGAFAVTGEKAYAPASGAAGWSSTVNAYAAVTLSIGGGQAHNNMPPYLSVYMWKRTA